MIEELHGDKLLQQLRLRQHFGLAILAGTGAGMVATIIWGGIMAITGLHVEFVGLSMVGIGFLVGKTVALCGRGVDREFAWLGSIIAALACLLSYLLSLMIAVAWQLQLGDNFYLIKHGRSDVWLRLAAAGFGWAEAVCFVVASWEGFRFSRLPIEASSLGYLRPRWRLLPTIVLVSTLPILATLTWLSVTRKSIQAIGISDQGRLGILKTTLDGGGEVEIWNLAIQRLVGVVGQNSPTVRGMALSAKGNVLAIVTKKLEQKPRPGQQGLSSYGAVSRWNLATGKFESDLPQRAHWAAMPLLTPDGIRLLLNNLDRWVIVWNMATQSETTLAHNEDVGTMALTADGKMLVTTTATGIHVWDVETGQIQKTIPRNAGSVAAIALAANNPLLAIVFPLERKVELFDLKLERQAAVFSSNQDWLTTAEFSPDGKTLAIGGGSFMQDGIVELWNVRAQQKVKEMPVKTNTVRCLAFIMEGKEILAGSTQSCRLTHANSKGKVHRWEVATGKELSSFDD
ncbi:MAG: hypothetical protein K8T91_22475 [Planctomycetes bacterium]|nr:hypothetical protein [Planctomycetota bacterium]